MNNVSFYESTGRNRVGQNEILVAQNSYTYNYRSFLPESIDAVIMDLGSSDGILIEWLLNNGYRNLVGIDSDAVAGNIAKARLQEIVDDDVFVTDDILNYLEKCDDSSADMIFMLNIIEHITKDRIVQITSEIHRVLKKGGKLLVQTGNWENPFNIGLFTRDFTHNVMYTGNSLRQLMTLSGFDRDLVIIRPVGYKLTIKNFPLFISSSVCRWFVKSFAACMRMRITETAPLIYCQVQK